MNYEESRIHLLEKIREENDGKSLDFMIPSYASKKIDGYMSMKQDLNLCIDALDMLTLPSTNKTVSLCLFYTIIALYGKCFTDSSKTKYPKLEASDCFDGRESFLAIHNEIMNLRHNFVAHRGNAFNEHIFPYIKIEIELMKIAVGIKEMKIAKPDQATISNYKEVIRHLLVIVEQKMTKAIEKVFAHIRDDYSIELFSSLKIAGPTNY